MLAVPADQLPAALADLDPGNRALLDLSLRRGVSDAEIGELLRKEPDEVARGRDTVLGLLADALDVEGHDRRERVRQAVAALPDDAWRARRAPAAPAPPPRPEPPRERASEADDDRPEDDFYFEPEERRSRRGGLLAVLGLLIVVGALVALLVSGGDDDPAPDADRTGAQPSPSPDERPGRERRVARLRALGSERGGGRVAVGADGRVVISIRGLPRPEGAYEVWLYDNVVNARSLGKFSGPAGRAELRLPAGAGRYRFFDVSREPADANLNHSGDSVLRAPLRDLLSG